MSDWSLSWYQYYIKKYSYLFKKYLWFGYQYQEMLYVLGYSNEQKEIFCRVMVQKNNNSLQHLLLELCEIRIDLQNKTTKKFKILKYPKRPHYIKHAVVGKIKPKLVYRYIVILYKPIWSFVWWNLTLKLKIGFHKMFLNFLVPLIPQHVKPLLLVFYVSFQRPLCVHK